MKHHLFRACTTGQVIAEHSVPNSNTLVFHPWGVSHLFVNIIQEHWDEIKVGYLFNLTSERQLELICTRTLTFFMIFNFVASIAFSFLLFTFVPGWYIVLHERFTFDIIKNMTSFYLTFYVLVYTTILFFIFELYLPPTSHSNAFFLLTSHGTSPNTKLTLFANTPCAFSKTS